MKFLNVQFLAIYLLLVLSSTTISKSLFRRKAQAKAKSKSKQHIHVVSVPGNGHHHHQHHHHVPNGITIGGEMTNIAPTASKVINPRLGIISFLK